MSKRSLMLATEVRSLIAPILRTCPQECGIVSITRVEISDDNSYATLYISALMQPELALKYLDGQKKELQRRFAGTATFKIPVLRFRIDDMLIKASRIDQLLEEASKQLPQDTSKTTQE